MIAARLSALPVANKAKGPAPGPAPAPPSTPEDAVPAQPSVTIDSVGRVVHMTNQEFADFPIPPPTPEQVANVAKALEQAMDAVPDPPV